MKTKKKKKEEKKMNFRLTVAILAFIQVSSALLIRNHLTKNREALSIKQLLSTVETVLKCIPLEGLYFF